MSFEFAGVKVTLLEFHFHAAGKKGQRGTALPENDTPKTIDYEPAPRAQIPQQQQQLQTIPLRNPHGWDEDDWADYYQFPELNRMHQREHRDMHQGDQAMMVGLTTTASFGLVFGFLAALGQTANPIAFTIATASASAVPKIISYFSGRAAERQYSDRFPDRPPEEVWDGYKFAKLAPVLAFVAAAGTSGIVGLIKAASDDYERRHPEQATVIEEKITPQAAKNDDAPQLIWTTPIIGVL